MFSLLFPDTNVKLLIHFYLFDSIAFLYLLDFGCWDKQGITPVGKATVTLGFHLNYTLPWTDRPTDRDRPIET